jgi:hypothetical protein
LGGGGGGLEEVTHPGAGGGHRAEPFCASVVVFAPADWFSVPGGPGRIPGGGQSQRTVEFPDRFPPVAAPEVPFGPGARGGGQPHGGSGGWEALVPFGPPDRLIGGAEPLRHGRAVPFPVPGVRVCALSAEPPNTPPNTKRVITPIAAESVAAVTIARFTLEFIAIPSEREKGIGG